MPELLEMPREDVEKATRGVNQFVDEAHVNSVVVDLVDSLVQL